MIGRWRDEGLKSWCDEDGGGGCKGGCKGVDMKRLKRVKDEGEGGEGCLWEEGTLFKTEVQRLVVG